jgi:ABC-type nitrate/sulfonate/bicarbonate transport system ATPase subunit
MAAGDGLTARSVAATSRPPAAGRLTLHGVAKEYRLAASRLQVLKDIDLDVAPGEFVSIVGSSGCGKSTLLRLIVGLDPDYDGRILLDGRPVQGTSLARGIVFQDHRLLPWLTLEENIGLALENMDLPRQAKRAAVAEHIALVGLGGFERAYPHQLSGGMAQRAAISRGLVSRPEILLLDEPFGALDALTRLRLQDELLRIWSAERVTVILVTHDVEEAIYLGDKVVVMQPNPGRISHQLAIDLPGPRDRTSHGFTLLRHRILAEMGAVPTPSQSAAPIRVVS